MAGSTTGSMTGSAPTLDATNVAFLDGTVTGTPRWRTLPSGCDVIEFDVTTRGGAGPCSTPVVWFDPPGRATAIESGRAVLVLGVVRRRFFRTANGVQSRTEVVAGRVGRADRVREARVVVAQLREVLTVGRDHQRT